MERLPEVSAKRARWTEPHVVYELYDSTGQPLYVGCTIDLLKRLAAHGAKSWWRDVAEVHTRTYPDRDAARAVEKQLIHDLEPAWNFQCTERARESAREQHRARRASHA